MTSRAEPRPIGRLSWRIAIPLALFATHVLTGFSIAAASCEGHAMQSDLADPSLTRILMSLLSVLGLLAVAYTGGASLRDLRVLRTDPKVLDPTGRLHLELTIAIGAAAAVALYLLWTLPAIWTVPLC